MRFPFGSACQLNEVRHGGGAAHLCGSRFVCCILCAIQWHMERIRCTYCGRNDKVTYFAPEGQAGIAALKAESCEHCRSYIKIMHLENDPQLDPVADDLASLALDLAMAEQGGAGRRPCPFLPWPRTDVSNQTGLPLPA